MSDYNEEAYENALIELFQNMGWEHVYGPDIERDWHSTLYDSIRRINPTAAPSAIDDSQSALLVADSSSEYGA